MACALGVALLAAATAYGQEQVRIQVPESVVFEVLDAKTKSGAPPSRLAFDQAILASDHRLRVSVRAERLDFASSGAPPRIFFTAHGARGGTGFSGPLRETDFTPVFEGDPFALAGGVEIAWTLERFQDLGGARVYPVFLRWKVESVPGGNRPGNRFPDAGDPLAAASGRASAASGSPGFAHDAAARELPPPPR
ncbi:MAG TPA: hypothetical protein VGX68_04570 [Thermoanaerobaculia bacterium]|jgi:hypothetical protein|nr:hypothetical protein [Thermoanaerobaculia bacterium]